MFGEFYLFSPTGKVGKGGHNALSDIQDSPENKFPKQAEQRKSYQDSRLSTSSLGNSFLPLPCRRL